MTETFALGVLVAIAAWMAYELRQINHNLKGLMATVSERLQAIDTRLGEASTEILALIAKLQGETLTPDGQAALDALEIKANSLADIVTETPTPTPGQ